MMKIWQLIPNVNPDATVKQEWVSCDAGQYSLYVINDSNTWIELRSSGDYECLIQDNAAHRICNIYDN